jgi:hypothetical protein
MIKAIETNYCGYRFRSRLEARYAVFFNALGIKWEYEFEGFVLPSGEYYLPDFFLPTFDGGTYVEVKPKELTAEEREKCWQLCIGLKTNVWLAVGTPDLMCYEVFYYNDGKAISGDGIPNADQAEFENRMFAMSAFGETGCPVNPEYRKLLGNTITLAVSEAKKARFEHGENKSLYKLKK